MADPRFDVAGIGNAIVDVLANAEDSFVASHSLPKGGMTLIDAEQAETLYAAMGPGLEASGGSAANTIAGLAALGVRTAFIGKVHDDALGNIFRHDIRALGTHYETPPLSGLDVLPTARCLILVSADAERTMATFLGACTRLAPEDIDESIIQDAAVTYVEGYLWDMPAAKDAIVKAADHARSAGRKVALSLSDSFCVDRHRQEFLDLIDGKIDILFANEGEITALFETDDFDAASKMIQGRVELAALTRSAQGCRVVSADAMVDVPCDPVSHLVDTTGAGDQFAAGFLYGYVRGKSPETCGRLGAITAAEVVAHFGARPEAPDMTAYVDRKMKVTA